MQENELENEELQFELIITKSANDVVSYTIDEDEIKYILQQIKFNQPFVLSVNDSFFCYSPSQCPCIEIKPIK